MEKTIPLFGVYHDEKMDQTALEVLKSGQIASGHYVKKFEDGFGKLVDQTHVVSVNDMSSAIQIALRLIGVGPGDEVLTSPFACMSTNAPIATSGATPVWVDIDPSTGHIDPAALERAITPRSKAVLVYHLAGYPCDIREISAICQRHGLKLIEDCDNAMLATVDGVQVGRFGDFAIYSFYPNRQINATEGGALCCKNYADAERAIKLRRYGIDLNRFRDKKGEINPDCDIAEIGWAATLNNFCSAIGYSQLTGVVERIEKTRSVALSLTQALKQIEGIEVISPLPSSVPSYWVFLVKVRNRNFIMSEMKSRGINVSTIHQRTDLYSGFNVPIKKPLPNAEDFINKVLAIPCGWWMTEYDINIISSTLKNLLLKSKSI